MIGPFVYLGPIFVRLVEVGWISGGDHYILV